MKPILSKIFDRLLSVTKYSTLIVFGLILITAILFFLIDVGAIGSPDEAPTKKIENELSANRLRIPVKLLDDAEWDYVCLIPPNRDADEVSQEKLGIHLNGHPAPLLDDYWGLFFVNEKAKRSRIIELYRWRITAPLASEAKCVKGKTATLFFPTIKSHVQLMERSQW